VRRNPNGQPTMVARPGTRSVALLAIGWTEVLASGRLAAIFTRIFHSMCEGDPTCDGRNWSSSEELDHAVVLAAVAL